MESAFRDDIGIDMEYKFTADYLEYFTYLNQNKKWCQRIFDQKRREKIMKMFDQRIFPVKKFYFY